VCAFIHVSWQQLCTCCTHIQDASSFCVYFAHQFSEPLIYLGNLLFSVLHAYFSLYLSCLGPYFHVSTCVSECVSPLISGDSIIMLLMSNYFVSLVIWGLISLCNYVLLLLPDEIHFSTFFVLIYFASAWTTLRWLMHFLRTYAVHLLSHLFFSYI
jgi:hypothetical protein